MGEFVDVAIRIGAVTILAGIVVEFLRKKVTTRRSPAEIHDNRVLELERARTSDRAEVAELKAEIAACQAELAKFKADAGSDLRKYGDYVHDLRDHIARQLGPPPPDWPEGLRL